jgi:hypothetical protein
MGIVKMALRFGWSRCARLRMSKLEYIGRALKTASVASFGMGSSSRVADFDVERRPVKRAARACALNPAFRGDMITED